MVRRCCQLHSTLSMKARMNTPHTSLNLIASTIFGILILIQSGCGPSTGKQEGAKSDGTGSGQIVPVQTAIAERKGLSLHKSYSGSVEGEDQANIVAKIPERIVSINVHVGQSVQAAQVMIVLDKTGSSSQFYQAEANYRNAQKNLERMKSLLSEGAVSQETLDGAQTAFDVAKANFDAARGMVELSSPIAGLVTSVNASVGDLTNPGTVLLTVAKTARMKVIFNLNESDVAHLSVGQPVTVSSEGKSEGGREGRIIQLSKSADVGSRSFEVKALFPNTADAWYKPGMFLNVDVNLATGSSSLIVPASSIQTDGTVTRVFVVHGGRAFERKVELGVSDGTSTEVVKGLVEGDSVATVGVNNLRDSIAVMAGR